MESEVIIQSAVIVVDLIIGVLAGYRLSKGKTKKRNIIGGIVTAAVIAPALSILLSILLGFMMDDGWSAIGLFVITFPLFFFTGLTMLIRGIFGKPSVTL